MTIDERVTDLMKVILTTAGVPQGEFKEKLRLSLLEVARDQRHVCAEGVNGVEGDSNNPWMIDREIAHSAVMNANLK